MLFGFAEEAGVLSGHRVDEQSPIEEQIAGLTACLSDQQAAVAGRAMKGPIVRCRGRLVIAQMGSFEHTSRRSSAECRTGVRRPAVAARPPSVRWFPAVAV